jgi:glutamyl-tRNA reductase
VSVLVVGLSHRTAPVDLLERVVVIGDTGGKLLADVQGSPHVTEALLLSTCNRVEVYADVSKFHGGVADVSELLAHHSGVPLDTLTPHLYVHYEDRAVQHLFGVACGLDSMVVGEGQILGQVRAAFRTAQDHGAIGRVLHELVQQALRVGKRARSETGIDRTGASLVSVGLGVAERTLGPLAGRPALVVGAGSMSSLAVATLHHAGAHPITVVNRSPDAAQRLALAVDGRALGMAELGDGLARADLVVSCTGATGLVLTADELAPAQRRRGSRPLFVLDLALPRDVDPAVRDLPGVTLADLESLRLALDGEGERADGVEAVRRIVAEEVLAFLAWQRAAAVAPTVVALRTKAASVVAAELDRLVARLPDLDRRARAEVETTVRRVVDKLLHAPTVRVKELAEGPGGEEYALALRELFDLDPGAPEAVSRVDVTVGEEVRG